MNLVLWISTHTHTKVLVLVLKHFYSTCNSTRTHTKQSTCTRTQVLCTRPNPDRLNWLWLWQNVWYFTDDIFKRNSLNKIVYILIQMSLDECVPKCSINVSIGVDNGLVLNRQQTIMKSNDDFTIVNWQIEIAFNSSIGQLPLASNHQIEQILIRLLSSLQHFKRNVLYLITMNTVVPEFKIIKKKTGQYILSQIGKLTLLCSSSNSLYLFLTTCRRPPT